MLEISLLDGSILEFEKSTTGYEIACKISSSLGKNAYAIYVNNNLWDLHRKIDFSCKVQIVTNKDKDIVLQLIRHDLSHILAEAVLLMYPNTKLGVGPATENGFFYDFLPLKPFKEDDLIAIENKMKELIDSKLEFVRRDITKKDAVELFQSRGEEFKVQILDKITDNNVSLYKQGTFEDLCLGPHSPTTDFIPKSFKLNRLSGVYWQNSASNPMLQRISGIAFLNDNDLNDFLNLQSELEKNDHRKLGKELGLFHIQEEAVGSVFWHKRGWRLYKILEDYMRSKLNNNNYDEVKTPQLLNKTLWEASGHWDKFGENNMFVCQSDDNTTLALKPMNCPGHIQIFKQGIKSYKDLPLKMAEFGSCHRNEPSGSLHGIMRVRAFTQDDAHIFCTHDQIVSETRDFCILLKEIYSEIFGEIEINVKFSDRPEKRAGDDAIWDRAEKSLMEAAKLAGLDPVLNKGEGAFYGPKLEFAIKDSLGRQWQLGTLQTDFILPQRLEAYYIGEDGQKHHPVMLHRAILGSFERFIGILIEHYKGKFPLWLSPIHVALANISESTNSYVEQIHNKMSQNGISSIIDIKANKISYKIREHTVNKIPIIGIIGDKEEQNNTITLRFLNNQDQITLNVDDAIKLICDNIILKTTDIKF